MRSRRSGFTLLEMLLVVLIGGVILTMGTRQYSGISNRRAVINAANAMVLTANRARSEAMRSGRLVYLQVRPDSGLARVEGSTGTVVHTLDMETYGGDMVGSGFTICYAARGYALPGCTNITANRSLRFVRGTDTTTVVAMPLGQVRRTR
jgi:prepilin-type N-terminal cleavage/methylation domain-containing protein